MLNPNDFNPNALLLSPMTEEHIGIQIVDLEKSIFEAPYDQVTLTSYYDSQYSTVLTDEYGMVYAYLFAKANGSEIFIGNLGVLPDYQGQGLAKKLMRNLIAQAEGENKVITLRVEARNKNAIKLYRRFHFEGTPRPDQENFYMRRPIQYQNKKIMWIGPRQHIAIIQKRLPCGHKNNQYIFIDISRDFASQVPAYQEGIEYQLIVSGDHGDFQYGQPTQLIGKPTRTVETWVQCLSTKGFKFQNIVLHACLSAGFFPLFSELCAPEGLMFGHFLISSTNVLSLLNSPFDMIDDFRAHYFFDMKIRTDIRDELGDLPFISDVIYQKSSNTVFGLNAQGLERAINESNKSIHVDDNIDGIKDYKAVEAFLRDKGLILNTDASTLSEIRANLESPKKPKKNTSTSSPVKKQYSFFAEPVNLINMGITVTGLIAGVTLICLGSTGIGALVLAAALILSLMISALSITKPEMMPRAKV